MPPSASVVSINVGNVTASSEVTFEYTQKPRKEMGPALLAEMGKLRSLPFQVQIAYTRRDGAVCLRVITSSRPITHEVAAAEAVSNATPMVAHAARSTAAFAKAGRYGACSAVNTAYQGYINRVVRSDDLVGSSAVAQWNSESSALQSAIDGELRHEKAARKASKASSYVPSSSSSSAAAPMRSAAAGSVLRASAVSKARPAHSGPSSGSARLSPAALAELSRARPVEGTDSPRSRAAASAAAASGSSTGGFGGFIAGLGRSIFGGSSSSASAAADAPAPTVTGSSSADARSGLILLSGGGGGGGALGAAAAGGEGIIEDALMGRADGAVGLGGGMGSGGDYEDDGSSDDSDVEDDAMASATRVQRRAQNDGLAAQLYSLAKGGKKFQTPKPS